MIHKKVILSVVLALVLVLTELQAQEAVVPSGGNATGTGGTVTYTVGQVVYTTNIGSNGSVAQGVHQPYEISVVTAIEEVNDILLEFVVYPNPIKEFVKLKIGNYEIEYLSIQLYDIKGKLLQRQKAEGKETAIYMGALPPATYFLKVIQGNKEIKTFKLIKY